MNEENMRRFQRWPSVKLGRWCGRKTGIWRAGIYFQRPIKRDVLAAIADREMHDA